MEDGDLQTDIINAEALKGRIIKAWSPSDFRCPVGSLIVAGICRFFKAVGMTFIFLFWQLCNLSLQ